MKLDAYLELQLCLTSKKWRQQPPRPQVADHRKPPFLMIVFRVNILQSYSVTTNAIKLRIPYTIVLKLMKYQRKKWY